jgi:low affinity Fe/Cu permease
MPNDNLRPNDNPMASEQGKRKGGLFESFAIKVTNATGTTGAFILASVSVLVWAATGPIFHYSENWQFVINTSTSIVTFLMVFLIQKSQNKDSLAIQLKLNELLAAHEFASNRLVNVENMTEDELKVIQKYYAKLSQISKKEGDLQQSHSIDEAEHHHEIKREVQDVIESIIDKKEEKP